MSENTGLEFVAAHMKDVQCLAYAMARRLGMHADDALDIMVDKANDVADAYDEWRGTEFKAYMLQTLCFRVRAEAFRAARRRQLLEEANIVPPQECDLTALHIADVEAQDEVERILDVLSSTEREVLAMLGEGYSYGDIGSYLRISRNTAKKRCDSIIKKARGAVGG